MDSNFGIEIAQYLNSKSIEFDCLKNYWKDQGEFSNAMMTRAEQVRITLSSNRNVMLIDLAHPKYEHTKLQKKDGARRTGAVYHQ